MLLEIRAGLVLVPLEVAKANRSHFSSLGCLGGSIEHRSVPAFRHPRNRRIAVGRRLVGNRYSGNRAHSSRSQEQRGSKFFARVRQCEGRDINENASRFRRLGWCGTAVCESGMRRAETLGDSQRRGGGNGVETAASEWTARGRCHRMVPVRPEGVRCPRHRVRRGA